MEPLSLSPPARCHGDDKPAAVPPDEVLKGLRSFYEKTAQPDGSFRPGVDPAYKARLLADGLALATDADRKLIGTGGFRLLKTKTRQGFRPAGLRIQGFRQN